MRRYEKERQQGVSVVAGIMVAGAASALITAVVLMLLWLTGVFG